MRTDLDRGLTSAGGSAAMFPRWRRLGIRPQLTLIVVLGTILTTLATLFIADNAINGYVIQQASTQEKQNLKVARQVLENQYGEHISISTSIATSTINCPFGCMVIDLPGTGRTAALSSANNFGKFVVNGDTDFVDRVQQLTGGSVSVYQCNDVTGQGGHFNSCPRIATTVRPPGATQTGSLQRAIDGGKSAFDLSTVQAAQGGSVYQLMNAENHADVREWIGTVTMTARSPMWTSRRCSTRSSGSSACWRSVSRSIPLRLSSVARG